MNEVDPCVWREGSENFLYMRLLIINHVNLYLYYRSYLYDNYSDPLHWDNDTSERQLHSYTTCACKYLLYIYSYSQLSATSFITSIAARVKTADSLLPNSHYIIIDSLSVLLRRHGLSAVTKILDAIPGSQLPGE